MLKINVGLNKKASKDFNSSGLSINIEAELDSSLLARPAELQTQIDSLYAQAQDALDRQVRQPAPNAASQGTTRPATPASRAGYPTQRHAPAPTAQGTRPSATAGRVGAGNTPPPATDSQLKAIRSIAQSMGLDHEAEADSLGLKFSALSRGNASRFIDHLKSMQSPRAAA